MKFPFPTPFTKTKVTHYEITEAGRVHMRNFTLTPPEMRVLMALNDGPKTSYMLASSVGCERDALKPVVNNLLRHDYIKTVE